MPADYTLQRLSARLMFIQWHRTPTSESGNSFVQALQSLLNEAEEVQYFISDLRRGRIIDMAVINRLGNLTRHPRWGGSTAFSANPISQIFAQSFLKLASHPKDLNAIFDKPEDAIQFLESLCPGLTSEPSLDWNAIIRQL